MLIVCPTCVSAYRVDPEIMRLSQGGVRCAHCRRVWVPVAAQVGHVKTTGLSAEPSIELDKARMSSTHQHASMTAPISSTAGLRSGLLVIGGLAAILVSATLAIGLRQPIAQAAPGLAAVYASLGLPITPRTLRVKDVKTEMVQEGATPVLTLEGTIQNDRASVAQVPNIRIVVRDSTEQGLYTWTTAAPKPTLAPGEAVAFKSRLVAPPGNGHDVQVGFTDAHMAASDAVVRGTK